MSFRFSNTSVSLKATLIGVIVLVLMIPLAMLRGLVSERAQMREHAYATVANGWGGHVVLGGPVLELPFDRMEQSDKGERVLMRRTLSILPSQLQFDVELNEEPTQRRVGIYEVPVYMAHAKINGVFAPDAVAAAIHQAGIDISAVHFDQTRLRLPLSDSRSVRELIKADINGNRHNFLPASVGFHPGVETNLDLGTVRGEPIEFSFEARLAGSNGMSLLPLGATTTANMTSAWPDPKFIGNFLPAEHRIDNKGFTAHWQVLELNRAYGSAWIDREIDPNAVAKSAFGAELYQSVDIYQRSERAVKYALVFIALTFLTFFGWEQISKQAIHPLQYLLIGLALSTFYLLLIALTEHIGFAAAYAVAAIALVMLIGSYISGAMASSRYGLIVGAAMTITYAVLYMLVISEQYSLLMGAIVIFGALAALMLATRKIRWNGESN